MVWWCCEGVIHYPFLQPGQASTAESYCCDVDLIQEKLRQMWPAEVNRCGRLLLKDNARSRTSKHNQQKMMQLGIEVLPHTPYSQTFPLLILIFPKLSMQTCDSGSFLMWSILNSLSNFF